jgi:hypothetical protein
MEQIIKTRKQAKLDGDSFYFTGEPCKKGHVSIRWVSTPICVECAKEYNSKNPARSLLHAAKQRAKRDSLPFNLEIEDLTIPDKCPILGIPIIRGSKTCHDNSPSIDKIVPALGYVKGNIAIISHRANTIKSNANADELRLVADYIDNHLH